MKTYTHSEVEELKNSLAEKERIIEGMQMVIDSHIDDKDRQILNQENLDKLLKVLRNLFNEEIGSNGWEYDYNSAKMLLSPLLPTEEVGIKEDDYVVSDPFALTDENETKLRKLWYERNPFYENNADDGKDMFWGTVLCVMRDYVASKIHPQPSASLASHSCTIGNSIQQNRHFIVFYSANHINGNGYINGFMDFTAYGCYLNKELTLKQLKEKNNNGVNHIINNIIELSSEDYEMWSKEQNVKVSDTTEADSSNADQSIKISELREKFFKECVKDKEDWFEENFKREPEEVFEWVKPYLKIPSIDWEGLEKDLCRNFSWSYSPRWVKWLKTKLQDYIK